VFLEGEAASGVTIRVKVEVNTDEVHRAWPLPASPTRLARVGGPGQRT